MKRTLVIALVTAACGKDDVAAKRIADLEGLAKQNEAASQTQAAATSARITALEQAVARLDAAATKATSAGSNAEPMWWCGPSWCGRGQALCERTSKQPCEQRRDVYCAIVAFSQLRTSIGMFYGDTVCAPTHETCVKGLAKLDNRQPDVIDRDRCFAVR